MLAFIISMKPFQLQKPLFAEGWPSTDPTKSSLLPSSLGHVVRAANDIRKIRGTAGIFIGIMSRGEVVLEHHLRFADLENARVATSNTMYLLSSLAKSFIEAAVAQLVQDGVLKWVAPTTTYLAEISFHSDPSLADQLTLSDLLSHQTGLAAWMRCSWEQMDKSTFARMKPSARATTFSQHVCTGLAFFEITGCIRSPGRS